MASFDVGLQAELEKARKQALDEEWANVPPGPFQFTEAAKVPEKPKGTTWRERIHKVGEEMLADPSATKAERFLAGVHIGMRAATREMGAGEDVVNKAASYLFSPFTVPWNAFTTGLEAAGAPKEAIKLANDALISTMATAPFSGGRLRLRERSLLDSAGVEIEPRVETPVPPTEPARIQELRQEFQARMAESARQESASPPSQGEPPTVPGATEPAWVAEARKGFGEPTSEGQAPASQAASHPDFGQLVFFLLDGKPGTAAQRAAATQQASAIIAANPTGTIADFIPAALKARADRMAPSLPPGEAPPEAAPPAETPAVAGPPEAATTAEPLSDWQAKMVKMAEEPPAAGVPPTEPPTPPAAPSAEAPPAPAPKPYPPGFKNVPGGPDGAMAQGINSLLEGETAQAALLEQKRGVRSHDVTQAAADELRRTKQVTLADVLGWEQGTVKNAETIRAGIDLAEAAVNGASGLAKAALRGEYDMGAASAAAEVAKQALINASAAASELGRGLESLKMTGRPAGPLSVLSHMEPAPIAGGLDVAFQRLAGIEDTAGGARIALEQMAGLPGEVQRAGLGSLRTRLGKSGMEAFFGWIFWPWTAGKVVMSGTFVPTYTLATAAVGRGLRVLGHLISPSRVDLVSGIMQGEPWAGLQATKQAAVMAFSTMHKTWDALAKVAKEEGGIAAEQKLKTALIEGNEPWAPIGRKWARDPATTAANYPEAREFMDRHLGESWGDLTAKGIDVLGVFNRWTTDLLTAGHTFGYTFNYWIGASMRAHRIAMREKVSPEGYREFMAKQLANVSQEVDQAGTTMGMKNTFIQELTPALASVSKAASNPLVKITTSPVTRIPFGIFEYGMEGMPVLQNLMRGWWKDMKEGGGQRDAALGKVALGWVGMFGLLALAEQGVIVGSPPRNRSEREAGERAMGGDHWNSFHMPGTSFYLSFLGLEPFSTWFGAAATGYRIARDLPPGREDPLQGFLLPLFMAAAEDFAHKPIMQGLSRWYDIALEQNPDRWAELIKRQFEPPAPGQSTVRTVRRIGQAVGLSDDARREVRGWVNHYAGLASPEAFPLHRNNLTGEPFHYTGMWGGEFVDELTTGMPGESKLAKEIYRLRGAGIESLPHHLEGARPAETVDVSSPLKVPGVPITDMQRDRWIVLMTQEFRPGGKTLLQSMTDLVGHASWEGQSDMKKATLLKAIYTRYRLGAEKMLLAEDRDLAGKIGAHRIERQIQRLPVERQASARQSANVLLSTLGR